MKANIIIDDNNIVKGYSAIKQNNPLIKTCINFNESVDYKKSIEIDINSINEIKINEQQLINKKLVDLESKE